MESEAGVVRKQLAPALVTIALFVGLLGIDVWLGYSKRVGGNRDERIEQVYRPHPTLGWAPVPGTGLHESPDNFSVRYGIEPDSLRHVTNRGPIESSLWLFGDSFTFGHGVGDADTYASVMAREWLRPGLHVRNAGVMGYGIAQQLQRLIEVADRIEPGDRVVFAPVSMDVERSLKHFGYASKHLLREANGQIEGYPDWQDDRLVTAPFDTPSNRVRALFYNARLTGRGLRQLHHLFSPPHAADEALAMIARARAISEERGARFALLFLPQPRECSTGSYRVDLSSFEFRDLRPFFPDDPEGLRGIHFPGDPHWNERGHAMAARAVVATLLDEAVLAPDDVVADPRLAGREES
jgi:hypothetical protein